MEFGMSNKKLLIAQATTHIQPSAITTDSIRSISYLLFDNNFGLITRRENSITIFVIRLEWQIFI